MVEGNEENKDEGGSNASAGSLQSELIKYRILNKIPLEMEVAQPNNSLIKTNQFKTTRKFKTKIHPRSKPEIKGKCTVAYTGPKCIYIRIYLRTLLPQEYR